MDQGWDFNYNWDEADEVKPFTVVPNGNYQVVVSDVNIETTKNGEPMPALQLTIENHEEFDGQNLFDRWYMPNKQRQTEKAFKKTLGFMKQRLEALYGVPWTGARKLDPFDLIGRRAVVQVGTRLDPKKDDNGNPVFDEKGIQQFHNPSNEIKWWFQLTATGAAAAQTVDMGQSVPMAPPVANGGNSQPPMMQPTPQPMQAPQPAPSAPSAPSAAPAVSSPAPTQAAPAAAPSAPEAAPQQAPQPQAQPQGEPDPSNAFRL